MLTQEHKNAIAPILNALEKNSQLFTAFDVTKLMRSKFENDTINHYEVRPEVVEFMGYSYYTSIIEEVLPGVFATVYFPDHKSALDYDPNALGTNIATLKFLSTIFKTIPKVTISLKDSKVIPKSINDIGVKSVKDPSVIKPQRHNRIWVPAKFCRVIGATHGDYVGVQVKTGGIFIRKNTSFHYDVKYKVNKYGAVRIEPQMLAKNSIFINSDSKFKVIANGSFVVLKELIR